MIVCDLCKDVSRTAFQCHTELFKEETRKGKNAMRSVKKIPVHLCETCITDFIIRLGRFITTATKGELEKVS